MRMLARNQQKLKYSLLLGDMPEYELDENGNKIVEFVMDDGTVIYRETGSRVNQWSTPLEFLANIAQSGGEAEAMAFGFSVSDFDASIILAKGTVDLPIGTLIWHNSKPKYRDTEETMLDEKTADYRVLRALDSINFTRYLLKAVVK